MVRAWYMNSHDDQDQRTERHMDPPQFISLDELKQKTGVLYWKVKYSFKVIVEIKSNVFFF